MLVEKKRGSGALLQIQGAVVSHTFAPAVFPFLEENRYFSVLIYIYIYLQVQVSATPKCELKQSGLCDPLSCRTS